MIKKVTIQDIAEELQLSRNTVAKALTNSNVVAYDTRMAVIKKAWEMGYQKMDATMLEEYDLIDSSEKKRTVIILARNEMSLFWNSILVGISEELNSHNCRMRMAFVSPENEKDGVLPDDFKDEIDAVILMSVFEPVFTERVLKEKLPTVFLDSPIGHYRVEHNCDSVICDGRESVAAITKTLIDQGLRKIGFVGNITYCESLYQRYQGFVEGMDSAGLVIDESIVFTEHMPQMYSIDEVESIVNRFPYLPDAIVCANDDVAFKVMRAYIKKGIRSPRDYAITGFDNEEVLTQADPKLTTVGVRNRMLGRRLVQQLMWRILNPDFPKESVHIATKPIYRSSSNHKSVSRRES